MTLRFTDGFDSYASSADLVKKWLSSNTSTWSSTAGRNGGGAMQMSNTLGISPNFATSNVVNMGFWWKASTAPNAILNAIIWQDVNGATLNSLRFNNGGNAWFLVNASGTTQGLTSSINIMDNNWHWIEVQYNSTTSTSTNKCWIDGVQAYSGAALSLNTGTVARVQFFMTSNGTLTIDDLIIFDNTGSSPVTADMPLSPQQINTLRPNGDSAVQFSPDTGATNYTQVNEVNGDTTHYVQDGTSGHQDLYNYDDLSFSPAKIWGVMANAYANNPGIGSINHNQICKNNTTTTTGTTTQTPITNARVVQEPFVLDPNTGLAWASSTALNSALFGIKVT